MMTVADVNRIYREKDMEWRRNVTWRRATTVATFGVIFAVMYLAGKFTGAW
jgi:hypothetical protein